MKRVFQSWAIWIGLGLIGLGISIPKWFGPEQIGLDRLLVEMERDPTGGSLMITAFVLVTLNTAISLPYFLGAIVWGDHFGERLDKPWLRVAIPLAVVPLVHLIINSTISLKYNFDGSAILLLLSLFLLQKLGKSRLKPTMKMLVFTQLQFGVEWLNEVPFLTSYGFGQGSISSRVNQLAVEIGFEQVLTLYAVVLCLIFVINAVILAVYMGIYAEKLIMSQDLHFAQLTVAESRAGREVLHLVHDLKTPLTAVEGLITLIDMRMEDSKIKEYCQKISRSIGSMSEMISEILYEDRKSRYDLKDLLDYVRAGRLSGTDITLDIEYPADQPIRIWVNKIRMTRALINLIDNAIDSLKGKPDGKVSLRAKVDGDQIWLGVTDNGVGINPDEQEKVWTAGYSTKKHPGVGLSFVQQVAQGHGGAVAIDSDAGRGTTVWIQLPKGENEDANIDH